ncbi:hypothetical protein GWI33_008241 [Rhynchophorus ferrugineus]|uniref:Uncharacterized protein n=1 Tax=Rhynchophorus ferrugineus TaxID=354439 RepID=A0A834IC71_RHYFE|nr:hypothetical protein GWI33_008241 [Rhynchophorus ferrugineus]
MGLSNKPQVKLGKYTTRTLLKTREQDVLDNVELNRNKLHLGQLVKQIKDFSKRCLPKLLPKNMDEFKKRSTQKLLRKILIKYPYSKRWVIVSEAFSLAYNKNIGEYLDYFESDIVLLFNVEIRRQWGNLMYSKTSDTKYWTYLDPAEVFKLVKTKINVTSSVISRIEFLSKLVNSCHMNNDYNTYGEVLKYITQRHRNDDLKAISRSIGNNYNRNKFTDIHWKYIGEILEIIRTKGNTIPNQIFLDYLLYMAKHEICLDDTVKWFILDSIEHYLSFDFNINEQPEVWDKIWQKSLEIAVGMEAKKRALSKVIDFIVIFNNENKNASIDLNQYEAAIKVFQDTCQLKEHYDDEDYQIIMSMLTYNNQNPHTLIRVCDGDQLVAVLNKLSKQFEYRYDLINTVSDIVSKQNRNNFEKELLHCFVTDWFEKIPFYIRNKNKTMRYLVRNDPEITNRYFDLFLKYDTSDNLFDFGLLKKYSHLEFDQKFVKYHSGSLVDISSSNIGRILKGLALFMTTDDFLNLVSQYLPKNTKFDLKDYDFKNAYRLQCKIIQRFQQVDDPVKVIPYLSIVCHEDYLQGSLPTMYNILNRINENAVFHFIDTLKNQPLSVRKHSMFLAFNYMPLRYAINMYITVSSKEKNVSMKKHFLESILKFFMKNPLGFVMDIVLSRLDTLDKDDDEALEKLAQTVDNIPIKFRATFIEKLWRTLDKFAYDANKYRYRYIILEGMHRCFCKVTFSEAFCKDVIGTYFLSLVGGNKTHCNFTNSIVMDYLRTNDSQRFDFVFDIIKAFKENNWKHQIENTKQCLYDFFRVALLNLMTYDINILLQFEAYWKKSFSFTEHFTGFCSLQLLKLSKESGGDARIFAKGIDRYFESIIVIHGPHVNLLLSKCLQYFCNLNNRQTSNCCVEDLIIDMLKINPSPLNQFIGMDVAQDVSDNKKKNEIIQLLSRQHDQLSEIFYYSLFE